ncbi:biotin--[acetyl-CoA-carboxylase] ligase [Roseomonas elaeocarpi]|uniref:biotin--[biotin carboxyl-carrier protein] ligase n=1 Tax=Roseomonas elaeocarpi TaxID=907779 RepID=A0ABV6JR21_9PROT
MSEVPEAAASGGGWRLLVHESLPSTSDLLKDLAVRGEPGGLAVVARRQTAGRGQHGRSWESPPGNLYLSILLRPRESPRTLPQWGLLLAVALADTLAPLLPEPGALRLKWPNDLLIDGAKLAGILVEGGTDATGNPWLVVGIGVNLAAAPEVPGRAVTSMQAAGAEPQEPEAVARSLLASLDRWATRRHLDGFAAVRAAWLARGPSLDATLTVRGRNGEVSGRFQGLSEDGALLLGTGGRVHAVVAGEVLG